MITVSAAMICEPDRSPAGRALRLSGRIRATTPSEFGFGRFSDGRHLRGSSSRLGRLQSQAAEVSFAEVRSTDGITVDLVEKLLVESRASGRGSG